MTLTFPRTNDSHRNARNYRIDSQTPENTSHFAMRITLFSSLVFSDHLKVLSDRSSDRSAGGRRFHVAGPLTAAKLRCPVTVRVRATSRVSVAADRRC